MIEVSWLLFIVASLVLIVTPGQDMILVMSRSVAQGAAAGAATAAGVSVGLVGHTLLATLGLGAILRTSEWLFLALKLVGAAYLVYLGMQLLRTRGPRPGGAGRRRAFAVAAVRRRRAVQRLQPEDRGLLLRLPAAVRAARCGASDAVGLRARPGVRRSDLPGQVPGGPGRRALSAWLRARPKVLTWLYRSSGAVLVGLGLRLALERRP